MVLTRKIETLALDVEGTLISNAVSQFARPGLYSFLEFCRAHFPRLVVYTGVEERHFRRLACQLILEENAPRWFGNVPHLHWSGDYKDLRRIQGATVETSLLVDDLEECVHPDQKTQWIRVEPFERPYPASDGELARVKEVLAGFLR